MVGGFFDISEAGAKRKVINSPKVRVIFLLGILCFVASISNYLFISFGGLVIISLCFWAGVKWRYVFLRMLFLIPFGLGAIVLLPFSAEGTKYEWLFGLTISEEGISIALLLISKLVICHFIICLLLSTTTQSELYHTMEKLGVPSVLIEIMNFTMRYLAVLFDEMERMIVAQQGRGFTFRTFATWKTYKRYGELLGVLLIRSYNRSVRIHEAMVARGLNSSGED